MSASTTAVATSHHTAVATLLSPARLAPYLRAADHKLRPALRLYRWNIEMSAALCECLHLFEVALRNRIDVRLREWNADQIDSGTGLAHGADWLLDPCRLLRRVIGRDIAKAAQRAGVAVSHSSGAPRSITHDDVLAQLTMGTWRFLLRDSDPGCLRIWTEALASAFPHCERRHGHVTGDVEALHRLRNRIAHLEPVISPNSVHPTSPRCAEFLGRWIPPRNDG
ncbi:hypothetical protein [Antribacter gilvus]|uniref:hypothetical protein n=1 Tax=Antribacter gilvus TaxID=2304675 RepID=UPI000F79C9CC|nr:hypothetical protein [Antribacter gilvus]